MGCASNTWLSHRGEPKKDAESWAGLKMEGMEGDGGLKGGELKGHA